jgi:dihydrodipicolinate synthase/N-acetylneuraminate lyase
MKGEGPVISSEAVCRCAQAGELVVFNGRGGLELPDNLLAGCAGMIPAPDCADLQIAIFEAFEAGDRATVERLYAQVLPYIVFAMQSLDVAIYYGKRMFARRAGIDNDGRCRVPTLTSRCILRGRAGTLVQQLRALWPRRLTATSRRRCRRDGTIGWVSLLRRGASRRPRN